MLSSLIGLGGSLLGAGFQAIDGINQMNKGYAMNVVRPTYNMPNQIKENTGMYRQLANSNRMAGQSMAENNINRATQGTINTALQAGTGSAGILATASAAQANENAAMNDLATKSAQFQLQNKDKLGQALQTEAGFKDKEWDWNQKQKFQEDSATKAALIGAGKQNLFGAVSSLGSGITNLGMSGMLGDFMKQRQDRRFAAMQNSPSVQALKAGGWGMGEQDYDPNQILD